MCGLPRNNNILRPTGVAAARPVRRLSRWTIYEHIMNLNEHEDDVGSLSERVECVIQKDRELFDALES